MSSVDSCGHILATLFTSSLSQSGWTLVDALSRAHCTSQRTLVDNLHSSGRLEWTSAYGVRVPDGRFFLDGPGRCSAGAGDAERLFDFALRLVNFFLRAFDVPGWSGSSLSVTLQLEPPLQVLKGRQIKVHGLSTS